MEAGAAEAHAEEPALDVLEVDDLFCGIEKVAAVEVVAGRDSCGHEAVESLLRALEQLHRCFTSLVGPIGRPLPDMSPAPPVPGAGLAQRRPASPGAAEALA